MARGGRRPGAGRKPKHQPPSPDEVRDAADRAEGLSSAQGQPGDEPRRGRGRPRQYQDVFARQAEKLVADGKTDAEVAAFFEIAVSTLYRWKLDYSEFSEALKRGKALADDVVERSLFQRATGYSHDAVKIMTVSDGHSVGSHIERVPYVEHYPPDTTAAIFWLKNRRPDLWRDKHVHEHGGVGGGPIRTITSAMSAEEAADAYAATLNGDAGDVAPELH